MGLAVPAGRELEAVDLGLRRALLANTGGAWRCVSWDGAAWRVASSPTFTVDAPDGRAWMRLRCADEGARATKRWTLGPDGWTKDPEATGTWFDLEVVWVDDTAEAWAELFAEWADDAGAFLVRGVLARGASLGAELVRRAKVADKGAWLGPHPAGRRVVVLDFDALDPAAVSWPDWPGLERLPTPEEAARFVRKALTAALPGRFWGAAAAYRWSASTGVPGGKRGPVGWSRPSCHVAVMLDRPVYDASLAAWLRASVPMADASVAEAVKPLFLASPIFDGGASPWSVELPRVGLLAGAAMTEAPAELMDGWAWQEARDAERVEELAALAEASSKARQRELYTLTRGAFDATWGEREAQRDAERRQRFAEAVLARAADRVAGAATGTRHATLLATANNLGRFVAGGLLDEGRVRAELALAWSRVAGGREDGARAITDGLRDGGRSPRTWAEVRADEGTEG